MHFMHNASRGGKQLQQLYNYNCCLLTRVKNETCLGLNRLENKSKTLDGTIYRQVVSELGPFLI